MAQADRTEKKKSKKPQESQHLYRRDLDSFSGVTISRGGGYEKTYRGKKIETTRYRGGIESPTKANRRFPKRIP